MAPDKAARMTFRRYGRSYQLRLDGPEDLRRLPDLDESLWMAMSAPLDAFVCDRPFLEFLDLDENGRIRSAEVEVAVNWLFRLLVNTDRVGREVEAVRLEDINTSHQDGVDVRLAAARILANLGSPDVAEVTLAQVRDRKNILAAADANGDGIIPPEAAADADIAAFLQDILDTVGGETDAGGKDGVTETGLNQFFEQVGAFLAWQDRGRIPEGRQTTPIMPLGPDTGSAYDALAAVSDKIDEFFRLCATVRFQPSTAAQLQFAIPPADERPLGEVVNQRLAAAPVAAPNPEGILNLDAPLNPAYHAAVKDLRDKTLLPALGRPTATLTEEQWRRVSALLADHANWRAHKPDTKVEKLGEDKLRRRLEPRFRESAQALIEADKAVGKEIEASSQVEKLILYQRWLLEFVNNFVNFSHLYDPDLRAMFEIGTLIMDARHFALTVRVGNRADHARVAQNSSLFILYLELTQSLSGARTHVATAVTSGGRGNIYVGKQGIFIDRDGEIFDARVTQIIENPISIGEALTMPFRRVAQLVQSQVERFSGSGQKLLEQKVTKQVGTVTTAVQTAAQQAPQTPPKAPPSSTQTRNLLLGGGVAIAGLGAALAVLGSAFAYIIDKLKGVPLATILMAVLAVLLVVVIPIVINAWIKLRRRDLGALLEASGWAINGRIRLSRKMQVLFTRKPTLPPKSRKERFDQLAKLGRYAKRPVAGIKKKIVELSKDISEAI